MIAKTKSKSKSARVGDFLFKISMEKMGGEEKVGGK